MGTAAYEGINRKEAPYNQYRVTMPITNRDKLEKT
jgi:hypothetical protein